MYAGETRGGGVVAADSSSRPGAVILGGTFERVNSREVLDRASRVILLTYRKGFHMELPQRYASARPRSWAHMFGMSSVVTSDRYWGCAVRSTQMALAEALQALAPRGHKLDRAAIVRMFHDTSDAPFSIHNFVRADVELGVCVRPLQFGCASSAACAAHLINAQTQADLASAAFRDGVVYAKEVERAFQRKGSVVMWATIQKRMGRRETDCVRRLFAERCFKGIIGAERSRPRAYYLIGYDAESLLYLDPHAACTDKLGNASDTSELQTRKLHRLKWDQLGDAATFCFLFQEQAEFQSFLRAATSSHLQGLPFEIVMACAPMSQFH